MKKLLFAVLTGVVASVAIAGEMPWAKSFDAAKEKARAEGKLVMVDFYTDWCVWCKKLDSDTYTSDSVAEQAAQYVPVKVDAEKEGKDLAAKYEVAGFPTILFLDPNGEVMGRINGFMDAEGYQQAVSTILASYADYPELVEALKADPDDPKANARMAVCLAGRGKGTDAEKNLAVAEKGEFKGPEMAKAYNAVGDFYQTETEELGKAVGYFKKAIAVATEPVDRVYAELSIMYCMLMDGNEKGAKEWAQKVLADKDATKADKEMAESVLKGG